MEIKNTQVAGGVVLNQKGEVLVVNQFGTSWSLTKGVAENGESLLDAAKREIYEESGITNLDLIKELGSYQRPRIDENANEDRSEIKTITIYLFRTSEDILKPIDPENPEARWVEKGKVADLLTHPKDKEFFIQIKDKIT